MEPDSIVEKLLALRGVKPEDRPAFLDPSLKRLAKAESIPGVPAAVDAILRFVQAKRKIVVFGDYDCDGVCACAILVTALRKLGAVAEAFIPDRFAHGYGMTAASLAQMFREHPDVALVVTVDNGICSKREIAEIKARGVAVVVTDHHLPPPEIPEADALVDPKVASAPGCDDLCGAGIAFFLAQALASAASERGLHDGVKFGAPLLVLAGLATVADLMPLVDQNRILVKNALARFAAAPAGLRELNARASRRTGEPKSRDFGFLLSPRINAAGRVASAHDAYDLLMASDAPEAREEVRRLAMIVDTHNVTRKSVENGLAEQARAAVGETPPAGAIVYAVPAEPSAYGRPDLRSGVAGIVAARLLEHYGVSVAIVVGDHGSARAADGCNVHDALAACADETLVRFGGHAAAGGFTLKPGKLEDFRRLFAAACAAQRAGAAGAGGKPFREPDLWLDWKDFTLELARALDALEPFGEGNPEPVFGVRGAQVADARPFGRDGAHLSLSFAGTPLRVAWWCHGGEAESIRAASPRVDASFKLVVSDYGGDPHVELNAVSVRPA
ncbi:MAG: DHH family phosphoesterase [Kiritimatiellae bacterium]|nr:DHH family phosphoesterase [Kiritimatiellia bacterium]